MQSMGGCFILMYDVGERTIYRPGTMYAGHKMVKPIDELTDEPTNEPNKK